LDCLVALGDDAFLAGTVLLRRVGGGEQQAGQQQTNTHGCFSVKGSGCPPVIIAVSPGHEPIPERGRLMTRRLLLLTACVAALAGRVGGEPEPSRWLTDLAKAEKESSKTGKPLFVVFRCEH